MQQSGVHPSICLFHDYKKLHTWKNQQYICRAWLMPRSNGSGRVEVTHGKGSFASMVNVAGHCSGENPAWLTYAASGNAAV